MNGVNASDAKAEPSKLPCGVYRHYREGNDYLVLGVARHSETDEPFVIYARLYSREGLPLTVRPLADFVGNVSHQGREVPRFVHTGLAQGPEVLSPTA